MTRNLFQPEGGGPPPLGGHNPELHALEGKAIFDGAFTFVYLGEITSLPFNTIFRMNVNTFTNSTVWRFGWSNNGQAVVERENVSRGTPEGFGKLAAGLACLVAATKEAGEKVVRWHKYDFGTKTWTHISGTTPFAATEGSAGGTERFLELGNDSGKFDACAVWNRVLSDAEVEALISFKLLDEWLTTSPRAFWIFDYDNIQEPIKDLTGNGADVYEEKKGPRQFDATAQLIPVTKKVKLIRAGIPVKFKRWVLRNGTLVNG